MASGALRRADPRLFEAPAKTPVSLQEVKDQAVVEVAVDDVNLQRRLDAAIEWVEKRTGRRLITQTYDLAFNAFPPPGEALVLPYPPLQAVVHVKYTDTAGVLQTLDAAEYQVRTVVEPGEILEAWQKRWPSTRPVADAVTVRYRCGFGDEPANVPASLREAICVVAATRNAFREEAVTGTIVTAAPLAAERLLARWIRRRARPSGRA